MSTPLSESAGLKKGKRKPFKLAVNTRQLHHEVYTLAWPSVITMLMQTVNSMMDVFFVGHLPNGKNALAATGIGGSIIFLLISLAMGVSVGTTALVARFTGAEDHGSTVEAAGQSITLSLLCGIVFGSLFYIARGVLIGMLLQADKNQEAAALCNQFLQLALLASVPLFVTNVLMGAFRGLGDTRTPMIITAVMIAVHIGLNAVLIYGRLGFPALGVRGAATALATSITTGMLVYLLFLRRSVLKEALTWKHLKPHTHWAWRIFKIGIPASAQAVVRQVGMMWFTSMLAGTIEGTAAVAALQIGIRAESLAFMPGFGYSVAASALVGQSLGAKDVDRAEKSAWAATLQGVIVMSIMSTIFFVFARQLSSLFTNDPMVRMLGTDYLRVNAFCEPFLALSMVLMGAFQGAGDTVRPTFITILTMWVFRLPFGWMLMYPLHMQTHGAWVSMSLSVIIGGLMSVALFRTGKWKKIKV